MVLISPSIQRTIGSLWISERFVSGVASARNACALLERLINARPKKENLNGNQRHETKMKKKKLVHAINHDTLTIIVFSEEKTLRGENGKVTRPSLDAFP